MCDGDRLVTYHYKTIIFNFNASPFILNYVLKYHGQKYADDKFSKILKENLYVDNMLVIIVSFIPSVHFSDFFQIMV